MIKSFLLALSLIVTAALAEPPASLYEIKTIKTPAGVTFEIRTDDRVHWNREYPATLRAYLPVGNCALYCESGLILERQMYRKEDFIVEDGLVSISVPVKVVSAGELNVEIKFAVCDSTSCYRQKAEVAVRF